MTTVTLKGQPVTLIGELPEIGSPAPDFQLTASDLSEKSLNDYKGHRLLLSVFPSLDTGTCAKAMVKFNQTASELKDLMVLCISADLPFAHARFCTQNHLEKVQTLSTFRHPEFGADYGVTLTDGPLQGLLARSVILIDQEGRVRYTQLVPEISHEPDYESVLLALSTS